MKIPSVPIDRKILLTFDEAAEYSGIDVIRIKELMEKDDLDLPSGRNPGDWMDPWTEKRLLRKVDGRAGEDSPAV